MVVSAQRTGRAMWAVRRTERTAATAASRGAPARAAAAAGTRPCATHPGATTDDQRQRPPHSRRSRCGFAN